MLNEAPRKPKKKIDYAHPNGWQLFWRLQKEGWRRAITPALMYFFMSLLMLASQAITIVWLQIVLGVACIAGGIFFNAHLLMHFGSAHYDVFLSGQVYRLREQEGIDASPDHHVEKEYRPWKGFFIGALIGFLWYNSFPAQIFMGDTGSLSIGGIIAVFALCIRKELLLPLLCGVFLVESLSVMLQVSYFKYTKRRYGEGRRILLMSPLHHHYQKKEIFETKIVVRFWIISLLLAAITLVTLKIR